LRGIFFSSDEINLSCRNLLSGFIALLFFPPAYPGNLVKKEFSPLEKKKSIDRMFTFSIINL